ncbi:MAG: prepilin-type N-terminal cleavage/methylation domain-containing protein [Azonexus sp.]
MSRQRADRRGYHGFTLIELIIALGIFMVLGVLSYRALASIVDSRDRVGAAQSRWSSVTRFMQRLEIDLQQIPANLPDALTYDGSRQTLRLVRLAPNGLGDDLRTIRYRWRAGRIERDERKFLAPPLANDLSEMIEPEVVLESVQAAEWLWPASKQSADDGIEWQVPPLAAGSAPPAAIGMRIRLADVPGDIFRIVALR